MVLNFQCNISFTMFTLVMVQVKLLPAEESSKLRLSYLRLFVATTLVDIGGADIVHTVVALVLHVVTTIVECCVTRFITVTVSIIVVIISTIDVTVFAIFTRARRARF